MPKSIQEILDHADELARRFEEYEPGEGDERPDRTGLIPVRHSFIGERVLGRGIARR